MPAKILAVDDDPILLKLISKVLSGAGYEVLGAISAKAAIEQLQGEPDIALLITDIKMPQINGFALLQFIRSKPRLARLPVLMCTGLATREAVVQAAKLNIAGYVVKPIHAEELRRKVRQVLATEPALANINETLERIDVDIDTYIGMLNTLTESASALEQNLEAMVTRKDYERLCAETDMLRGAAQNLGARHILNVLSQVVDAGAAKDAEAILSFLLDLQRATAGLRQARHDLCSGRDAETVEADNN